MADNNQPEKHNVIVNPQVTDSITETNTSVLGLSPSQAMSMLYQGVASTANLSIQNAQFSSQQLNQVGQAITSVACKKIMSLL